MADRGPEIPRVPPTRQAIRVTGGSHGSSALDGLAASAMRFLSGSGTGPGAGGAPPSPGSLGGPGLRAKKDS
jgi:hypothetical protein